MAKDSVRSGRATGGIIVVTFVLSALAGACATSEPAARSERRARLDSLRAANDRLHRELRVAYDSLEFFDDIYAGQYWRDRRRLNERIDRLRFRLARYADGGRTVRTYRAGALFEPASATLTKAGRARLDSLARRLRRNPLAGRRFRIEGHTDDVPVGPSLRDKYPSNWELSSARAGAVLRYLTEERGLSTDRFEMAGFGAARPVATNETAAGRRRNRRVRVSVLPEVRE